jgi:hypothetical protein
MVPEIFTTIIIAIVVVLILLLVRANETVPTFEIPPEDVNYDDTPAEWFANVKKTTNMLAEDVFAIYDAAKVAAHLSEPHWFVTMFNEWPSPQFVKWLKTLQQITEHNDPVMRNAIFALIDRIRHNVDETNFVVSEVMETYEQHRSDPIFKQPAERFAHLPYAQRVQVMSLCDLVPRIPSLILSFQDQFAKIQKANEELFPHAPEVWSHKKIAMFVDAFDANNGDRMREINGLVF